MTIFSIVKISEHRRKHEMFSTAEQNCLLEISNIPFLLNVNYVFQKMNKIQNLNNFFVL